MAQDGMGLVRLFQRLQFGLIQLQMQGRDGVIQVLLIVAVACYYPRPKTARVYVRSRAA